MEVPHSKGIANHTVPESCAVCCEAQREALTGVRVGQPLSRERSRVQGADAVAVAEGNTGRCDKAGTSTALRGLSTWHARTFLEREPGDLQLDLRWQQYPAARIGNARSRS